MSYNLKRREYNQTNKTSPQLHPIPYTYNKRLFPSHLHPLKIPIGLFFFLAKPSSIVRALAVYGAAESIRSGMTSGVGCQGAVHMRLALKVHEGGDNVTIGGQSCRGSVVYSSRSTYTK